jgi:adenosylhomocysteine nucleosidase
MDLIKIAVALIIGYSPLTGSAQRIAIMGAMDQEISFLREAMTHQKRIQRGGVDFYKGKIGKQKIILLKAGVGKVNAAYSTAVLTQNFNISALIFTGVAGGLHPEIRAGDIVIGENLLQYDFGSLNEESFELWPFYKIGGERHEELYIEADAHLLELSLKASENVEFSPVVNRPPRIFSGTITTGDLFISNREKANFLYAEYNSLATEMEGAAVAHICRSLDIPFVVLRSCSDNAQAEALVSFASFVGPASENAALLVMGILELME